MKWGRKEREKEKKWIENAYFEGVCICNQEFFRNYCYYGYEDPPRVRKRVWSRRPIGGNITVEVLKPHTS